ncbi:Primary amine oxidase [Senna tora]|uniref:Primary amine oxidase n=1 Tax=Senna tora TaxID=362788 RepID=A0A834X3A0_9FABA|nr:Primary amine oxidase [Senna tora]
MSQPCRNEAVADAVADGGVLVRVHHHNCPVTLPLGATISDSHSLQICLNERVLLTINIEVKMEHVEVVVLLPDGMAVDLEARAFGLERAQAMKLWAKGWFEMLCSVLSIVSRGHRHHIPIMVLYNGHLLKMNHYAYPTDRPRIYIHRLFLHKTIQPHPPLTLCLPKPPHRYRHTHNLRQVEAPLLDGVNERTVLHGQHHGIKLFFHG